MLVEQKQVEQKSVMAVGSLPRCGRLLWLSLHKIVIAQNLSELMEAIISSSTTTGKDEDQPFHVFSELSSYADFHELPTNIGHSLKISKNAEEQPQEA
jgi:hypothetical protein